MKTRHCRRCEIEKIITEFPLTSKGNVSFICFDCRELEIYIKNKLEKWASTLNLIKNQKGCENPHCYWRGKLELCQLQFHHINPRLKSFNLYYPEELNDDYLLRELRKCVVLCLNCHCLAHKTFDDNLDFHRWLVSIGSPIGGLC